jgi:hypothetical protein
MATCPRFQILVREFSKHPEPNFIKFCNEYKNAILEAYEESHRQTENCGTEGKDSGVKEGDKTNEGGQPSPSPGADTGKEKKNCEFCKVDCGNPWCGGKA